MKLVIIGNGFDLNHGYDTSYHSYKKFLCSKKTQYTVGTFSIVDIFEMADENLWNDFENALGDYPFDEWGNTYTSNINWDDDKQSDRDISYNSSLDDSFREICNQLPSAICQSLSDFVTSQTKMNTPKIPLFQNYVNNDNYFITFNYTDTLEKIYGIKQEKICHIHGKAYYTPYEHDYYTYHSPEIIFGHGNTDAKFNNELDEYDFGNPHKKLGNLVALFKKNYQLETLKECLKNKCFDEIVIIGHGLGSVDMPYFNKLNELQTSQINSITYFNWDKNTNNEKKKLLNIIFPRKKINILNYN